MKKRGRMSRQLIVFVSMGGGMSDLARGLWKSGDARRWVAPLAVFLRAPTVLGTERPRMVLRAARVALGPDLNLQQPGAPPQRQELQHLRQTEVADVALHRSRPRPRRR